MLKKHSRLILPPVLTIVVVLITYIIKGVYPFGSSNVAYYDMSQAYVSLYARNYEIAHGEDSILFEWLTGAGTDMTSTTQEYTLHPLNWAFFFVKPDKVLDFLGLFLAVKIVLMSLTIAIFLKKMYKLPLPMHLTLCMIYVFSGYLLEFYTNTIFLDSMILFPLLMLALISMFRKGRVLPYTLLLAFQLFTQPYMGILTLIFVLFYSFGLMLTNEDKGERRVFAARVGVFTFLAMGIAAVSFFSAAIKWTTLTRVSNYGGFDLMELLRTGTSSFMDQKIFVLFNTELAVALFLLIFVKTAAKRKKLDREQVFHIYVFLIMLLPVLNEGVLLIWHLGSYVHFPYRNGYMYSFAAIELIAGSWERYDELPAVRTDKKKGYIAAAAAVCLFCWSFFKLIKMDLSFVKYGIHQNNGDFSNLGSVLYTNIAVFIIMLLFLPKKLKERLILVMTSLQLLVSSVCFIAPLGYSKASMYMYYTTGDKHFKDSAMLRNEAGLENDYISRVKTLYPALGKNYSLTVGVPSITQWMSECPNGYFNEIKNLGYANEFTSNMDCGGTALSDALMNDKKLVVYKDPYVPEELYSSPVQAGDFTIYDMNYTFPLGILCGEEILDTNDAEGRPVPDEKDTASPNRAAVPPAEHQAMLAKALSGEEGLIWLADTSEARVSVPEEDGSRHLFTYDLTLEGESAIYVDTSIGTEISVNGQRVYRPYYDELENNNIEPMVSSLTLAGCYGAGEVTVEINSISDRPDTARVMVLDLGKLGELCEHFKGSAASSFKVSKDRLDLTAEVEGNNYMFIPLEYLDGWTAEVNGKSAKIYPVLNGGFMAVELPEGHCEITMRYMPPTVKLGGAVSAASALMMAVIVILKKRGHDIAGTRAVSAAAYLCFSLAALGGLFAVCLLPLLF